ncbi:MAG: hypothetical protein AAFR36_27720, partial [Bacteroidota bacterium]
ILYGTHLSVLVSNILKEHPQQPMSAKEVASQLADLPAIQQKNLVRRVRRSLNDLAAHQQALKSSRHVKNVVEHIYQIQQSCSENS